jgi:hypothetical protein
MGGGRLTSDLTGDQHFLAMAIEKYQPYYTTSSDLLKN